MSLAKMSVLLRLKTLKEEQALRDLQMRRRLAAEGQATLERNRQIEADSKSTLASREDAIYDAVLGRVIGLDDLDQTRGAVVKLEQDHALLSDAVERATHVLARLDNEVNTSSSAYRASVRVKDKYTTLTLTLKDAIAAEAEMAEDAEVEELFGGRRKALS